MPHVDLKRIARTLDKIPFPSRFAVEVTAHCNLACAMCHHPGMVRPKGLMPLELWRRMVDQIAAIAPGTHCWFSFCGEPLLAPDRLFEMLAYGRSAGLTSLNINTNGMPITPDLAEPLLSSGADLVVIGIDGFSKEVYEKIRIGGDRDRLYANIEHLLDLRHSRGSGPEIQVQFVEMDENLHEWHAFRKYWLERGATVKVRNKLSWGGLLDTSLDVSAEDRIPCPWALTMMHVFWDGRVPRCPGDTEGDESPGNAWDEPLDVLWEKMERYRHLHLEHRFDELPDRCQTCKDWMVGAAHRIRPEDSPAAMAD